MKTAAYWKPLDNGRIECVLCPHHCRMADGHDGLCHVRGVRDGELKALAYGMVASAHVDPIEKKPLHHFHPGSTIFSIGGWGCNLGCVFCQNWEISQRFEQGAAYTPDDIVDAALKARRQGHLIGIAYTYNEPLVGFEFVRDCIVAARRQGLANVLVTNGHVCRDPADELLPLIDALNVDIKSMRPEFYTSQCRGHLPPVLDFCRDARAAGCHIEITNLVIPSLNDSEGDFRELSAWVAKNLGRTTPLHLSAYRPEYKLDLPPTPPETLQKALNVCSRDLDYVYIGNMATGGGQDTLCPRCRHVLVQRRGYSVSVVGLTDDGRCARCARKADLSYAGKGV